MMRKERLVRLAALLATIFLERRATSCQVNLPEQVHLDLERSTGTPDSHYLQPQLRDQIAFDLLIRNIDRHQNNINSDPDYNLWMIDETRSLAKDFKLRERETIRFRGSGQGKE